MKRMVTAKSRHQCSCCAAVIYPEEICLCIGYHEYVCELCKNIANEFSDNFIWTRAAHIDLSQYVRSVLCASCVDKDRCGMNRMACSKVRKRYLGEREENI